MSAKRVLNWQGYLLFGILFFALSCEHKSAIEPKKDEQITWQQTSLDSSNINGLAVHPNGSIFAASCGNGIFRSTDRGATWTLINTKCVNVLAVHRNGSIFAIYSRYIFRSMNNGETWTMLRFPLGTNDLRAFAFNAMGEIFAGGVRHDESRFGGIYRSVDGGDNWLGTNFPDSISVSALAINKQAVIFAGTTLGVFRSSDNGQTWREMNNGFRDGSNKPSASAFAIHPINGDIFVVIDFDGVYRSSNNGDRWSRTGLTTPPMGGYVTVSLAFNSVGYAFAGKGLFATDPGVFYSADNGRNWSPINRGLTNKNIRALAIDLLGYDYAGTDGKGVFRTTRSTSIR